MSALRPVGVYRLPGAHPLLLRGGDYVVVQGAALSSWRRRRDAFAHCADFEPAAAYAAAGRDAPHFLALLPERRTFRLHDAKRGTTLLCIDAPLPCTKFWTSDTHLFAALLGAAPSDARAAPRAAALVCTPLPPPSTRPARLLDLRGADSLELGDVVRSVDFAVARGARILCRARLPSDDYSLSSVEFGSPPRVAERVGPKFRVCFVDGRRAACSHGPGRVLVLCARTLRTLQRIELGGVHRVMHFANVCGGLAVCSSDGRAFEILGERTRVRTRRAPRADGCRLVDGRRCLGAVDALNRLTLYAARAPEWRLLLALHAAPPPPRSPRAALLHAAPRRAVARALLLLSA